MNTALLVIDVQQGLCEGDNCAYEAAQYIECINKVSEKARAANALIIFIQHESKAGYLEYNTREWQLAEGLVVKPEDIRLRKTTPDSFHNTDLNHLLKLNSISNLVVCGMHTEFCVDTTTRRAMALGYPVRLVSDGHTTTANEYLTAPQIIDHHNVTLTNISSFGPRVSAIAEKDIIFGL